MEFEKYLKKEAKKISLELENSLDSLLKDARQKNIKLVPFAKLLIDACKGGKKIRGVLCVLGYLIAGGKKNKEIYKIAASLEIIHTAILIHDDIIDQSLTRRSKKTVYQVLGGDHYGKSQAISIADIGLYFPLKIIADSNFEAEYKLKALSFLSETIVNTGWGQLMDVEKGLNDLSKNGDKEFINKYKTAKYTISAPLQIGAILNGVKGRLLKTMDEFGVNLGIAFQIQDDILDKEGGDLKKALEYIDSAKRIIPKISKDAKMKQLLENMADFMVTRDK